MGAVSTLRSIGGAVLNTSQAEASVPTRAARRSECLSARESDVLMLVCHGMSNKRIALSLAIAPETVKAHVKRIFIKLDVGSRAEAVFRASNLGLLPGASER